MGRGFAIIVEDACYRKMIMESLIERICLKCLGSGLREPKEKPDPNILIDKIKPEPFDLDCCMVCRGTGKIKKENQNEY